MKNKTIDYKDLVRQNKQLDKLKTQGVVIIPKRRLKVLGWACVGLGVVTWFVPLTTAPLIAVGFLLLGLSKYYLIKKLTNKVFVFFYLRRARIKRRRSLK